MDFEQRLIEAQLLHARGALEQARSPRLLAVFPLTYPGDGGSERISMTIPQEHANSSIWEDADRGNC